MREYKIKKICLPALLMWACFGIGCNPANDSAVSEDKTHHGEITKTENSAVPYSAVNSATVIASPNKNAATTNKQAANESLPRKIDNETAESPVYALASKNCRREQATDDFYVRCKAYGDYILTGTGYDNINHYSIEPKNADAGFVIDLMPLAEGDASQYQYNDQFVQKLGDKITWLLDDQGKPIAIFVHASFYKAVAGGGKTFNNPKNKVAEFVFLRGLSVSEDLDHDIQAVDTAYNPDEWARKITYEVSEKKQK